MQEADQILEKLNSAENIIVYGAGVIAESVIRLLTSDFYHVHITCCAVSDKRGNVQELCGIEVHQIDELTAYRGHCLFLIASMDKNQEDILAAIRENGFQDPLLSFTFESKLWSDVRAEYLQKQFEHEGVSYLFLEDELQRVKNKGEMVCPEAVQVFMACCHVDRPLKNPPESRPQYIVPLQVGKCFTEQSVAELHDDMGENISAKNKQYCELTALYWIWKNAKAEYVGLCHYRRWFDLSQEEVGYLSGSDVDVVLTTPILNFPDVKAVYFRDHEEHDWQVMMDVLQEFAPEYYETACASFSGIYYYPYNMLIAKKEIFDAYCSWLFPLLEKIEECCSASRVERDIYQNRYIGFLAERLLSLYFVHNRKKYRIYHTRKRFFV